MNARLISLILCLALGLSFACSGGDSERPAPPVAASAISATPTLPPLTPTAVPAPPAPSLEAHPLGTRTGMAIVDAVIAAAEVQDANALAALIHFFPMPCTQPVGIGAIPCPAGAAIGTPVEVFGWGVCEGTFAKSGDPAILPGIAGFLERTEQPFAFDPRVYAVVRGKPFPNEAIPAEAMVVFASGVVASVDGSGLTYLSQTCIGDGEDWVDFYRQRVGEPDFILAPPR